MRAVVIRDGGILVEARPDPEPGSGEALVRVRAAGLNGADLLQRAGSYPVPPGVPADMPGMEFAGEVLRNGPRAERFNVGDRVMGLIAGAGQAELVVVHERLLMPVPAKLDWPAAGGLPEVFTTAHDALFTQCGLQPGERLLVHGAAGGVGTAAVQLGRATGARVSATVRNAKHREMVAALGAAVLAPGDFVDAGPFDVILELVGAPNMRDNLRALRTGGRISVIGTGAGATVEEFPLGLLMARRGRIHGSTLRGRSLEEKALTARALERSVLPLFATGALRVPVHKTFSLERAAEAYDAFAAGGKLGKIVLTA
ncbi:zinc-binding dehydrogenase [Conexibacter sp. S30A1]|uniref:zinc-binding dehydrogenase n=1 Tax=Conexibacter sp. S30A1 TaxID=2937800 RepID=UPI00200BE915|nr:zinc-binding dehydrogenase [Conexibacter sp. S30A1]